MSLALVRQGCPFGWATWPCLPLQPGFAVPHSPTVLSFAGLPQTLGFAQTGPSLCLAKSYISLCLSQTFHLIWNSGSLHSPLCQDIIDRHELQNCLRLVNKSALFTPQRSLSCITFQNPACCAAPNRWQYLLHQSWTENEKPRLDLFHVSQWKIYIFLV